MPVYDVKQKEVLLMFFLSRDFRIANILLLCLVTAYVHTMWVLSCSFKLLLLNPLQHQRRWYHTVSRCYFSTFCSMRNTCPNHRSLLQCRENG